MEHTESSANSPDVKIFCKCLVTAGTLYAEQFGQRLLRQPDRLVFVENLHLHRPVRGGVEQKLVLAAHKEISSGRIARFQPPNARSSPFPGANRWLVSVCPSRHRKLTCGIGRGCPFLIRAGNRGDAWLLVPWADLPRLAAQIGAGGLGTRFFPAGFGVLRGLACSILRTMFRSTPTFIRPGFPVGAYFSGTCCRRVAISLQPLRESCIFAERKTSLVSVPVLTASQVPPRNTVLGATRVLLDGPADQGYPAS